MGDHARSPGAVVFFFFIPIFSNTTSIFSFFLSFFLVSRNFPTDPFCSLSFFCAARSFHLQPPPTFVSFQRRKKKMPMRRTTTGQGRPPDFDGKEKKQQRRRKIPLYHAAQVRRSENFTTSLRERIFVLFLTWLLESYLMQVECVKLIPTAIQS